MPRENSIEIANVAGQLVYRFTDLGLTELRQLAIVGTPESELAAYFGVPKDWIDRQLKTELAVIDAFNGAAAEGNRELRNAMHEAAKGGDSRVLTFLGERRLRMLKTVQHQHEHKLAVIGTLPKEKLQSGDWFDQFAPKDVTAQITHDDAKEAIAKKRDAEDAEIAK